MEDLIGSSVLLYAHRDCSLPSSLPFYEWIQREKKTYLFIVENLYT